MRQRIIYFSLLFNCVYPYLNGSQCDFSENVYQNIELLPFKTHGWSLHEEAISRIFSSKNIKVVAEVGVWTGKWSIYVAQQLPPDGKLFAIDHWNGTNEYSYSEKQLIPTLYQQFLSNVIHSQLTAKIIPMRLDSLEAAKCLKELSISPDLIYIDASHDYVSVYNDINAYFPLISPGGLLCGDDYSNDWPGVKQAVHEFAEQHGLSVCIEGNFWYYEI